MTNFISKDSINRLLKDVKNIIQNPLIENGIYYIHDDSDLLKGYALIVGPEDTPYFGGYYFFELSFPFDYPHTPPKVKYCTNGNDIRFNPNLYKCGKVCISLLNTWRGDQWTSCQTISTVLLTLCTLLCKDPLLNEPGISKGNVDMKNYTNIIDYSNLNIAVCDIINKKEGVYHSFFENFEPFVTENFLKNYDKLIEFAENKNNEFINKPIICTNAYNMKVILDYEKIIEKLKNCKLKINLIN
jgi:ubiquitin-protein ligase